MVPTSDERREVAARLRSGIVARNIPEAYVAIVQSIGVRPCLLLHDGESGDRFDRYAYELALSRLADLIDPTCEMTDASWDNGECTWGCICSACDAHIEHEQGRFLDYCPSCGARVVSSDDKEME